MKAPLLTILANCVNHVESTVELDPPKSWELDNSVNVREIFFFYNQVVLLDIFLLASKNEQTHVFYAYAQDA